MKKPIPPPAERPAPGNAHRFQGYVVCIGASAGGLDALEKFFKACPANTGAAFVVVQHLSPDHKSMMSNLLARHTTMPVTMVEEDMPIDGDHVYLIPPGALMHVTPGHLHLTPKNPRGLTLTIDVFFSSLADSYGRQAVGVVLSGTGTDGTRGAVAVNAAGGFLMAQEPESAKFDGMPRSVIATGLVDAVLPAEELPARLVAHLNNLPCQETAPAVEGPTPRAAMSDEKVVTAILRLLHQVGGIDFSDYKPNMVMRRIDRRMQVCHTPALYQYYDLLEQDRNEIMTLRRQMLIAVTSFFRDADTFAALADLAIAPMVAEKDAGDTIRVWIAGVATGEEAYTIGILFIEAFERERRWPNLKIFATDVDPLCIEAAGVGQYPESAAAELSSDRLERFFVKKDDRFVIKNELRQRIVFARHNLLTDPPFTRMDLVVCRNMLIYFKAPAQERALRSLQYALNQNGVLLLGSSESLSSATTGLQTISARHKLFRRRGTLALPFLERKNDMALPLAPAKTPALGKGRRRTGDHGIAEASAATLLALFAPPTVVVNQNHEAVHWYGDVNVYFSPREGAATLAINRLLPDTLAPIAAALLYKADRDRCSLVSDQVVVTLKDGQQRRVRLSVHPLHSDGEERLTLLCFEAETAPSPAELTPVNVDVETVARVDLLERELAATRESLQATIEELETSNEELQATNEELMASNEELQSSNEELQSVNEEMNTVNAEFQEK